MEWLFTPSNFGIIDFPTYLLGTILTILFPGPNSLYVLTITSRRGWQAGAWAAFGIFIGDAILMIAVALGAATLLNSSPVIFNILRTLGAVYLAFMGYSLIRVGMERWKKSTQVIDVLKSNNYLDSVHPTLAALTLSLTNPKSLFFFVSFFAQFIQPAYTHPLQTFLYLATVLQFLSMTYLIGLIFTGQFFLKYFEQHPRYAALLWAFVGVLLIGFAGKLLL